MFGLVQHRETDIELKEPLNAITSSPPLAPFVSVRGITL
jgi:hypothetical protein